MPMLHYSIRAILLSASLSLLAVRMVVAQPPSREHSGDGVGFVVTLALVEKLPHPNATAVVLRRSVGWPRTLVLLPKESASAGTLSAAVSSVFRSRRRDGDQPTVDISIAVAGNRSMQNWNRGDRELSQSFLARLRNAPLRAIDGVGVVPSVDVRLGALKSP